MVYQPENELRAKLNELRITSRDIANRIGVHPATVRGKLAGYSSLTRWERRQVEEMIDEARAGRTA